MLLCSYSSVIVHVVFDVVLLSKGLRGVTKMGWKMRWLELVKKMSDHVQTMLKAQEFVQMLDGQLQEAQAELSAAGRDLADLTMVQAHGERDSEKRQGGEGAA